MTVPAPKPSRLSAALSAARDWLLSPAARRYEVALVLGLYQAVRTALGKP